MTSTAATERGQTRGVARRLVVHGSPTPVFVLVRVRRSAQRSDNFIVGLTNVSASEQAPVMGSYAVCGQYAGTPPAGATVSLACAGGGGGTAVAADPPPPARFVIVQFPATTYMNFCELDVCTNGIRLIRRFSAEHTHTHTHTRLTALYPV